MNLAFYYPLIYWNTACLIVNSGSTEDSSTDYEKLARALGNSIESGIKVKPVDINHSELSFKPDAANNQILFGMKGLLNVSDDLIKQIIANRPYTSPKQFYKKIKPNKQAMLSLIKCGAFDTMMERRRCMVWYIWETCEKKKEINLRNMRGLIENGLIPKELEKEKRIFEFNRYLKACCKLNDINYKLDERAINFMNELSLESLISDELTVLVNEWDKYYQKAMDPVREWMRANQDEILQQNNEIAFMEAWNKSATGSISDWELEVMCFYYHEHVLADVNFGKYGIKNFKALPQDPIIDKTFTKGDKVIELKKIDKICGTCIAKNKDKALVSLLTPTGVVSVKFSKEFFAMYDKQISQPLPDGGKKVIEKSWFNRGEKILVQGFRSGDNFVAKRYQSTGGHTLYKIVDILKDGDIELVSERCE